jgi:hypothetical protein
MCEYHKISNKFRISQKIIDGLLGMTFCNYDDQGQALRVPSQQFTFKEDLCTLALRVMMNILPAPYQLGVV